MLRGVAEIDAVATLEVATRLLPSHEGVPEGQTLMVVLATEESSVAFEQYKLNT